MTEGNFILEMHKDNILVLINKLHSSVVLIHVDTALKKSPQWKISNGVEKIMTDYDTVWTSSTMGSSAKRFSIEEKKTQRLAPPSLLVTGD